MSTSETIVALAVQAMGSALTGSPVQARGTVDKVVTAAGDDPNLLRHVITSWVDAAAMDLGWQPGTRLDLDVTNRASGENTPLADAPPAVAWASRIVGARVARDEAQTEAQVFELFATPGGIGDYLATLLDMLTVTMAANRGLVRTPADNEASAISPTWNADAPARRANADLN